MAFRGASDKRLAERDDAVAGRIARLRADGKDNAAIKVELRKLRFDPPLTPDDIDAALTPQPRIRPNRGKGRSRREAAPVAMEFRPADTFRQRNPRWLWPDRVAKGELNILVGDPETLKTTIVIDIAARCTIGAEWPLTTYRAKPCSVMWIGTSENAVDYTLLPRFRAAGGDASKFLIHDGTTDDDGKKRPFAMSSDVEILRDKIIAARDAGQDVRLLVFDPTPEFLGPNVDSWKDDQVRALVGPLTQLAKELDFAIIGIMHPRKAQDADRVLSNIAGSGAWWWLSRSIMFTKRLRDEDERDTDEVVVMWEKCTLSAQHPPALKYRAKSVPVAPVNDGDEDISSAAAIEWLEETDARLREMMGGRKTTKKGEAVEWLQGLLADGPRLATEVAELAKKRGISEKTLRAAKADLAVDSKPNGMGGQWTIALPDRMPLAQGEAAALAGAPAGPRDDVPPATDER